MKGCGALVDDDNGKLEVLGTDLFQCHFIHQKLHMHWPWIETRPPQ